MNLKKLLSEGKIEKVEKTEFSSELSEKDLEFAKKGMETGNYDRVMTIAYEAVLRAGNKMMNFMGYRSMGKEHHKNVFEFLREIKIDSELTNYFDTIRKKRNDFIYRDVENVSKEEVANIIKKAEMFVQKIRTFVQKIRTKRNDKK